MHSALVPATRTAPHHNLRAILGRRGFRRLVLVRLLSQIGDGWFQAGLASSVFFNPEKAASPIAIVSAFAVLLLPYSLLGPFVGVFLDRWSRRNTLFLANVARAMLVLPAALSVWYGREDMLFVASALGVIALNRFFLAGLAASIPHVVDEDRLVTANSFASTAGTVVYALSVGSAGLAFHAIGAQFHAYAAVSVCAAAAYALAAGLILGSFRFDALGPDDAQRPSSTVTGALADAARGMIAGLRHLAQRPAASSMLFMQSGHRAIYGILSITTLVLYRNYYNTDSAAGAITGLLPVAMAAAGGSFLAAILTPTLTRHVGGWRYLTALTGLLAIGVPLLSLPYLQALTVAAAFLVSLGAQATKIVTDTTLQLEVEDDFRGRVFSVNDTGFNLLFVVGLLIGALAMPDNGRAPALMVATGLGYAALATWFGMTSAHRRPRAV